MDRNERVLQNLNLVYNVANSLHVGTNPDAIQEGFLGLIFAAERYDEGRGKFSTYAVPYIRGYILEFIHRDKLMPDKRIGTRYVSSAYVVSTDLEIDTGDDDAVLGDIIPDPSQETSEQIVDRVAMQDALSSLTEVEQQIWNLKLEGKTNSQIGEIIGWSTTKVERYLRKIAIKVSEKYNGDR